MTTSLKQIFPTNFEFGALGVIAIAILFLGNSKSLLNYYGLDPSARVIRQSTQHVVGNGLTILDDYSLTSRVVTFAIWAFVGLICYCIVISVAQVVRSLRDERLLSSGNYVHPADFTKRTFWRQVSLNFVLLMVTIVVLGIVLYGFFAVILPVGLKYAHEILFHTSLSGVIGFTVAAVIVYLWLLLIDVCLRILLQRHRFTA